jgi:hypothetical protein
MSAHESWYARLSELAGQYGEDVVRTVEQYVAVRFPSVHRDVQLAVIEHLTALQATVGNWEDIERMARAIASGRPPHVGTEPQHAAIAVRQPTGRRGSRGIAILVHVVSPTAGYATLATRCRDAIQLSAKGRRALEGAGIRYVYELVQRSAHDLGQIPDLADDLAAIIRFCDKFGLPLPAKLDPDVITRAREMIGEKK